MRKKICGRRRRKGLRKAGDGTAEITYSNIVLPRQDGLGTDSGHGRRGCRLWMDRNMTGLDGHQGYQPELDGVKAASSNTSSEQWTLGGAQRGISHLGRFE
eukprot:EG_transcript_36711